ncbi:MAG: ribonuclease Z [Candidatus Bathyarchaeia archaeon]
MEVIFLGTGAGVPSVERGLACIALKYEGQLILFDCGEGAQRQMMRAHLGFGRRMKVFVTHLHGDHVLGVPGLLQTMSLLDRREKLEVYGPEGLAKFIATVKDQLRFNLRYPLEVLEVGEGVACRGEGFKIQARWVEHTIPTLAYAFIEDKKPGKFHPEKALELQIPKGPMWHRLQHGRAVKLPGGRVVKPEEVVEPPSPGVKIVYSGDTRPCRCLTALAEEADLLIHESTFGDEFREAAEAELHSTPSQAATLAKKAKVKRLILTHVSARYRDPSILVSQAREVFESVEVAEDFMRVIL